MVSEVFSNRKNDRINISGIDEKGYSCVLDHTRRQQIQGSLWKVSHGLAVRKWLEEELESVFLRLHYEICGTIRTQNSR
jgi:hypothetical protein